MDLADKLKMALDEGRMSKLERAGTHRCVAK